MLTIIFNLALLIFSITLPGSMTLPQEPRQEPGEKPGQQDSIAVETNLVVVNVTIRDARRSYVAGLTRENFQILEDGIRQEILSFNDEENAFTSAILLDSSGSMESKLSLVRSACAVFVDGLGVGDSYSIFSFGDAKVRKLQNFTEIRDLPDAVWDLKARGQTPLYDAIIEATAALSQRPERRRAIVIVSDGADTQSRASLDEVIRKAVEAQLLVYAVDLTDSAVYGSSSAGSQSGVNSGAGVLKSLTTKTGGQFFQTPGGSRLREAFAETIEELRHQYTVTYSSSNERQDGRWRSIEVRVNRPDLRIRTRQGYWARRRGRQ